MSPQHELLPVRSTLRCGGHLLDLSKPLVMGILNVTPDSFFDGGRHNSVSAAVERAGQMLKEGAAIIDVGGMSTRPGAELFGPEQELERVLPVLTALHEQYPEAVISIDTVWSDTVRVAAKAGALIVNDVSAGRIDPKMYDTVAELRLPYILMHMQGRPADMQHDPQYVNAPREVLDFFIEEVGRLREKGVADIILDTGFGFGKTVAQNFELLANMHVFRMLEIPLLAGLSRKSMICKTLSISPKAALNGTTALHMLALQQGASILRAHDVREAVECISLFLAYEAARTSMLHNQHP